MMRHTSLLVRGLMLAGLASLLVAAPAHATFSIAESTGLFTPSFRGEAGSNWFGYSSGTFFGNPVPPTASRILNNTPPTLGNVGLAEGFEFYQNDRFDSPFVVIGASSGNLYTGQGPIGKQAYGTMVVPTDGSVGSGFTTIILQGITNAGGPAGPDSLIVNYPRFKIDGNDPDSFVIGGNAANTGQWWAKFELPGNLASYTINIEFPGGPTSLPISLAGLTVDSYWSLDGYAPDVAAVPEPSSLALLGIGIGGAWLLRRRTRRS